MAKFRTWAWWITHPKANWDHMLGDLKWKKNRVIAAYQRTRYGWAKRDIHCGLMRLGVRQCGRYCLHYQSLS